MWTGRTEHFPAERQDIGTTFLVEQTKSSPTAWCVKSLLLIDVLQRATEQEKRTGYILKVNSYQRLDLIFVFTFVFLVSVAAFAGKSALTLVSRL